jgi:hypothetical protein
MPFIGNQPADKFLTLEKQVFTTSATDTYSLRQRSYQVLMTLSYFSIM